MRKITAALIVLLAISPLSSCMRADPALAMNLVKDERREGRRVAILTDDYFYCHAATGEVFRVPRTFETDFASIPPAAQSILSPFGNYTEAAVIHDWLYAVGEPGQRDKADRIFFDAMAEAGVNDSLRLAMYDAVRLGGASAYGAASEWRFSDPNTLERIDAPIAKPASAAVAKIDCDRFAAERMNLRASYSTQNTTRRSSLP